MRKFLVLLASVGMVLGLAACGNDKGQGTDVQKDEIMLAPNKVIQEITQGLELPAQMEMEGEMFNDTYAIDTDLLESYTVMIPMMSVHANEIAVLKVKDEKDVAKMKEAIRKRAATAEENMLYPEQKELIGQHKIASNGKYVLYVVDQNAETIVKNFEALGQ